MIFQPLLTLAAGWFELVIFAVVIIVSLIQYIIKKAKEADVERQRRQEAASSAPSPTTPRDNANLKIRPTISSDPVEQLRRQRLAKTAKVGSPSASNHPNNLTLQQMKARAQAKALYEKRAAELRRQKAPQAAKPSAPASYESSSRQPTPTVSQPVESQLSGPANRPIKSISKKVPLRQSSSLPSMPSSVTTTAPDHGEIDAGESVVHRHVPDVSLAPSSSYSSSAATVIPGTSGGVGGGGQVVRPTTRKISRNTLRRAMMLKEILDAPVAMR